MQSLWLRDAQLELRAMHNQSFVYNKSGEKYSPLELAVISCLYKYNGNRLL